MNNPARNAMIICGDGMRPERDDTKTYQQNPPQPTAPYHSTHCIVPLISLHRSVSDLRLPLYIICVFSYPYFAFHSSLFLPCSHRTLPSFRPHSSLHIPFPFHPPFPLCHHSPSPFTTPFLFLSSPFQHPFFSHPSSFHLPSRILSSPLPHPFFSHPSSFHFHSRFVPLQAPSNDLQIRSSRLRLRTAHEGVNTNLTCSEPGRTRPRDGSGIVPDGD